MSPTRRRRLALAIAFVALLAGLWFGVRGTRAALLLQSAAELGQPDLSDLRAWMSVRYVADTTGVDPAALGRDLQLAPHEVDLPVREIAQARGIDRLEMLRRVQAALATRMARAPPVAPAEPHDDPFEDWLAGWILVYGYPVMVASLMIGAMGAPLPSGLSLMVVGALAAQGRLDPWIAGAAATLASVAGDLIGYFIGQRLGEPAVRRHGHWIGLDARRLARAQAILVRWGAVAVVLSRSLVSFLSSAVNLLSGALRQPLAVFVPAALAGRALWSAGYLAIGFGISAGLYVGTGLMRDLTGVLVCALIAATAGWVALRDVPSGTAAAGDH